MLCYHGTDLKRFAQKPEVRGQRTEARGQEPGKSPLNQQPTTKNSQPRRAVYLGAMGSGYDLQTIIEVAARWQAEDIFPFQIHFAGDGPQREALETRAAQLGLTSPQQTPLLDEEGWPKGGVVPDQTSTNNSQLSIARIVFHGHVKKEAITDLLLSADLALVPNRPDSLVACPYKAGEYAAAGLPMISCLKGELGNLLNQWNAGTEYNEGDAASLHRCRPPSRSIRLMWRTYKNKASTHETWPKHCLTGKKLTQPSLSLSLENNE
jgi:glycosyltransferase involved in cell wall biosynthesis